MDLTLSTALEINTTEDDLSDVKTMMDSISLVPGALVHRPAVEAAYPKPLLTLTPAYPNPC